MSRHYKLRTTYLWHDSRGGECEAAVIVEYTVSAGYPQTWEEPGAPDEVEVLSVTPVDLMIQLWGEVDLQAFADECLDDWREDRIAALDARAEARRDDLMMEKWA